MADFFFFTDYESILGQNVGDNFGPISNSSYRVNNVFQINVDSKAYAACDAIVLGQFSTHDSINLILKPLNNLPFNIGKVKYFIYRGIKSSSLVDGVNIATRTNNDLTEKIWFNQEQTDINAGSEPNIPVLASLGLSFTSNGVDDFLVADTAILENVFFKGGDVQLPMIKSGDCIGLFIGGTTNAGFEIVLDRIGSDLKMDSVRSEDHTINITSTMFSSDYEKFLNYTEKEKVLNYIDPCAFYGLFSGSTEALEIPTTGNTPISLNSLIEKFLNKNRIYLDIRNSYNKSFNYYAAFGSSIGITFDNNVLPTEYDYYDENISSNSTYGTWPLFIIENQSPEILLPNENGGKLFLSISDENEIIKCLYFSECRKGGKYMKDKFATFNSEDLIEISSWTYNNSNQNVFGASYISIKILPNTNIKYEGLFVPGNSILDHRFPINRMTVDFFEREENDVIVSVYNNSALIERNVYPEHFGDQYEAYIGISKDKYSFTFFMHPNANSGSYRNDSVNPNFTITNSIWKGSMNFLSALVPMTFSSIDIDCIEGSEELLTEKTFRLFKSGNGALNNNIEPSLFDCIQITHEQYESLLTLIDNSGFINDFDIYLGFDYDETYVKEMDHLHYRESLLVLEGFEFVPDSNDSEIRKKTVSTEIYLNTTISKNS